MIKITAQNKYGQQIQLTGNPAIKLAQVTGLTPPPANINTSALATKDGSIFNSSHVQNRNIVLTIYPAQKIEQTRVNLYQYFKTKQYIKLHIQTALRRVWIEGYIESIDGDLYENPQKMQVSIICPDPYFKSEDTTVVSFTNVTGELEFPINFPAAGIEISTLEQYSQELIYNQSDDETGVVVELYAGGTVSGITLTNETTGQSFTINQEMNEGDEIILNTRRGEKRLSLVIGGITTNIINTMDPGSDWFTLVPGDNIFNYQCEEGAENLNVKLILQPIFEGV